MNLLKIFLLIIAIAHYEPGITGLNISTIKQTISRKIFFFLSNCTSGAGEPRLLFFSPHANATGLRLESLETVPVNASFNTIFLIHGFLSHGTKDWVNDTVSALLANQSYNIFVVDWRHGACSETIKYLNIQSYSAAAANTRVVGEYVASCIESLWDHHSVFLQDVWVIGHSLGAHVAGFAGKFLYSRLAQKLGRITGLDPAGPLFKGLNSTLRLDKTDAIFVEVTHTSNLLGLQEPIGDIDIYYNGGKFQRSCLLNKPGCSHERAVDYYIEAIRNSSCQFIAKEWSRVDGYKDNSTTCATSCTVVGPSAPKFSARGTFYVQTNTRVPYCTGRLPVPEVIVDVSTDDNPLDANIFDVEF